MSSKLHGLVWEGCAFAGLILSRVAVMARLADYSNDEGVSWPAVETIQQQIGAKSKTTVSSAIDELEREGWLVKQERKVGGRNLSNLYILNVEKLELAASAAKQHYRKEKKQPSKTTPPNIEGSTVKGSTVDLSNIEGSTVDKSQPNNPPMVDPDPSLTSTPDPSNKNTSGQPPAAEARGEDISKEIKFTDEAIEVLKHLNQLTGAKYTTIKTNLQNIRARLTDGHDKQSLLLVVDYLVSRWLGTEWAKFLNPETMFRPTKFDGNLLAASAWHSEGRKSPSQQLQAADHTERDAAYKRFISGTGQNVKPSQLEKSVSDKASKSGIRSMNASFAVQRWNAIWKECSQRVSGEAAA
ncbi:conserved phage C-terminal domain-containing protein [Yersinia massiliensis]|uniref:conserved phage C-terminal domain-containing protein n=1 Tax=Yersinia massiliensis TaxID=419257 RepID=UPI000C1473F5|nr:conserved phage C-terminal domain-containing protein [Yersinia massiliensis]PHZ22192.1 GntR family transcriptional regulator [Yersinia massiliensis]